jgi:hypothetical protein
MCSELVQRLVSHGALALMGYIEHPWGKEETNHVMQYWVTVAASPSTALRSQARFILLKQGSRHRNTSSQPYFPLSGNEYLSLYSPGSSRRLEIMLSPFATFPSWKGASTFSHPIEKNPQGHGIRTPQEADRSLLQFDIIPQKAHFSRVPLSLHAEVVGSFNLTPGHDCPQTTCSENKQPYFASQSTRLE